MKTLIIGTTAIILLGCAREHGGVVNASADVTRHGDEVFIGSARPWSLENKGNSVVGAYAAAMQSVGEDYTYAELMGLSATAFRYQLHEEWCPSSPHSCVGFSTCSRCSAALPFHVTGMSANRDDTGGVARIRATVKASIDRGMPVPYGSEENGLIVGYRADGDEWLCVHPYHFSAGRFVETNWPWGIAIIGEPLASPPGRDALFADSLRCAVEMFETNKIGAYFCGRTAWEQWIAVLTNDAGFASFAKNLRGTMQGNFWIYDSLVDARKAAVAYLENHSSHVAQPARGHVLNALAAYQREVAILTNECPAEIAPPPWKLKKGEQWTAEQRHTQAAVLEQAFVCETNAIANIKQVLTDL
ncbi:hypothetical protein GX586_03140 [bacterium]|nr:hypothetical protein [bacterium]